MAEKKKHFSFSTMHLSDVPKLVIALFKGQLGAEEQMMNEQTGFYEINLVPDVKADLIKAQKVRNLVFFVCIVISVVSISTAVILGSIKGAQDITMAGQDAHMKNLSKKITGYEELPEFLTIQNQINGIAKIEDNQKVLSRAILFLNSLIPRGSGKIDGCVPSDDNEVVCEDTVEISEIAVDLNETTMAFNAQANAAGREEGIDYRVLETFIKRTNLMTFDYGRYVDSVGNEIPSRCIDEYDENGNMLQENGSIYAIWRRGDKACDPSRDDFSPNEDGTVTASQIDVNLEATNFEDGTSSLSQVVSDPTANKDDDDDDDDEEGEEKIERKTVDVVYREKIYRTPQFTKWYNGEAFFTEKDGIDDDKPKHAISEDGTIVYNTVYYKYTPSMDESGAISGIPHFESKCITYSGTDTTKEDSKKKTADWSAENSCMLVPEGIVVTESANGRDGHDRLVLTFAANVKFNADAFAFRNKHIMAIGPNGQNVTDSYVQLEKLFAAPAEKCDASDTECANTPTGNSGKDE